MDLQTYIHTRDDKGSGQTVHDVTQSKRKSWKGSEDRMSREVVQKAIRCGVRRDQRCDSKDGRWSSKKCEDGTTTIPNAHRHIVKEETEIGWVEMRGDCGVGVQYIIQM